MPGMQLSLIVAMDRKGVIGRGGGLPWRLSADLKRFKSLTMGHHIVMGRKTFDSLGRPLPGRTMVVVSRKATGDGGQGTEGTGPVFVRSLEEGLSLSASDNEAFIIGGAQIFELALPQVQRMYVTWVEADVAGDVTFPQVDWLQWREVSCERVPADAKNDFETAFCIYERI